MGGFKEGSEEETQILMNFRTHHLACSLLNIKEDFGVAERIQPRVYSRQWIVFNLRSSLVTHDVK